MGRVRDGCDILVLVALDEESDALLARLPDRSPTNEQVGNYAVNRTSLRGEDGVLRQVAIIVCSEPGERIRELGVLAASLLEPEYVINAGISGAVKGDALVGDIVLPTEWINYMHRSKAVELEDNRKATGGAENRTDDPDSEYVLQTGGRPLHGDLAPVTLVKRLHSHGTLKLQTMAEYCAASENLSVREFEEVERLCTAVPVAVRPRILSGLALTGPIVAKSKAFREKVLRTKAPDALAIDMESGQLADALRTLGNPPPVFLAIRGISDPGTADKERLDKVGDGVFRRWALDSIATVLEAAISNLPLRRPHDQGVAADRTREDDFPDELAKSNYEPQYVGQKFADFVLGDRNEARFPNLIRVDRRGEKEKATLRDFIATLARAKAGENHIVRARGGCGKSALLYFSFRNINDGADDRVAFYFDLEKILAETRSVHLQAVMLSLRRDVAAYLTRHPNKTRVIFLFDGCIGDSRENDLQKSIRAAAGGRDVAVFAEGGYNRRDEIGRSVRENSRYLEHLDYASEFELKAASMHSPDDVAALVTGFLGSIPESDAHPTAAEVIERLSALQFDYINHYIVSIYLENHRFRAFRPVQNASLFIEKAMLSLVPSGPSPSSMYRAICIEALRAHSNELLGQSSLPENQLAYTQYSGIFAKQPRAVQTTMIARAVIELFSSVSNREDDLLQKHDIDPATFLKIVYDNDVNTSIKHFMADPGVEKRLLDSARVLAEREIDVNSLSFSLYLLGRITSNKYKATALAALRAMRSVIEPANKAHRAANASASTDSKYEQLSHRSLYISLANHGDQGATDHYIGMLTSDPVEDELNRGFHLEYYGDRQSDDIGVELQFSDDLGRWNRTTAYLRGHLDECVGKTLHPVNQVRLVTYLSFIRARHEAGRLSEEDRRETLDFIASLESACQKVDGVMPRYVAMISRNLARSSFEALDFIIDLYKLKEGPRAGWRSRKISTGRHFETVASHSFGCALLAEILLDPAAPHWAEQDIARVKALTLLHDIGEFHIGDYLPSEKADVNEPAEIDYISMMGGYTGLRDLGHIRDMFFEYEAQATKASRLARDIDKMDALIQGHIYRDDFKDAADFRAFMVSNFSAIHDERLRAMVQRLVP